MINFSLLESKRLEAYHKYRIGITVCLVFLLISIIGFTVVSFLGEPLLFIIPSICFCLGISFLIVAVRCKNHFLISIKPEIINYTLKKMNIFSEAKYLPYEKIEIDKIYSTGLLEYPDDYYGWDYIQGKYKDVFFEVSDVMFQKEVEVEDDEGEVTYEKEVYFSGRWYVFHFDKSLKGVLQIVQKLPYNRGGLTKIETESISFNRRFRTFTSNQEFAFYILTPVIIENIILFDQASPGAIYIGFIKNQLHIGIDDSRKHLSVNFKQPISQENLQHLVYKLELISQIVNDFKIYTNKFMNVK